MEGSVEEHPTLSRTSSEVWATSEAQKGLVEWLRTNSRTQSGKKITRLFWGIYLEAHSQYIKDCKKTRKPFLQITQFTHWCQNLKIARGQFDRFWYLLIFSTEVGCDFSFSKRFLCPTCVNYRDQDSSSNTDMDLVHLYQKHKGLVVTQRICQQMETAGLKWGEFQIIYDYSTFMETSPHLKVTLVFNFLPLISPFTQQKGNVLCSILQSGGNCSSPLLWFCVHTWCWLEVHPKCPLSTGPTDLGKWAGHSGDRRVQERHSHTTVLLEWWRTQGEEQPVDHDGHPRHYPKIPKWFKFTFLSLSLHFSLALIFDFPSNRFQSGFELLCSISWT